VKAPSARTSVRARCVWQCPPFAGKQRRGTHLAQVDSHRIAVRLRSSWSQYEIDVLRFFRKLSSSVGQGSRASPSRTSSPCVRRVASKSSAPRGESTSGIRSIPLVVSQISFSFSASISFLMSSIAKRDSFSVLYGEKRVLLVADFYPVHDSATLDELQPLR